MDNNFQENEGTLTNKLLDAFRDEYTKEIYEKKQKLLLAITNCCQQVGDNYGEEARRTTFNELVDKLMKFDELESKLSEINQAWLRHSMDFRQLAYQQNVNIKLEDANKCMGELREIVSSLQNNIHRKLNNIMESIIACRGGRQEAGNFQRLVCDLFEWLFIDRLKRKEILKRTSDGSQIKDGVFEIEEEYVPDEDFGCSFQYLYLECKNYKNQKPKSKDLFQLFGYTLFVTNTGIFQNIPLCLLISRRNPDVNDLIWHQRWRIYDKFERRLILFLDDKDLLQMGKNKCRNDNPGEVIKAKIKEIQEQMITSSGKMI